MTLTLALLTACDLDFGSDYAEVLPDERLAIDMPVASTYAKSVDDKEWAEFYLLTAQVTDDVNGLIGTVLGTIDLVTDYRPTSFDRESHTAVWGPMTDALDPNEWFLTVDYEPASDEYTWVIEARPKDSDDSFAVAAGEVDAGATRLESTGRFALDFDQIAALDPTENTFGKFYVEYALLDTAASAQAWFEDAGEERADAYYDFTQVDGGEGRMDLVWVGDTAAATGAGLDEVLLIRSRWQADGAGRSDVYVTEGDLGEDVVAINECWDTGFERVYYADNSPGSEPVGDEAACVFEVSYPEL